MSAANLKPGLFVVAAPDGYRAVFTYSEIFNRNHQTEVLIVPAGGVKQQGAILMYPTTGFFSDRTVHCLKAIRLIYSPI